ncbi:MAG TPA: molybdopterin-guanine dinucleotide biosynthesis protein MobB, partial [Sulfurihydrogenibium azorense]|nr:molybdopterin-guanine dinucleotide biosynthesis protein MobB [Sulfurihydrogenibium azorense]
MDKPVICIVGAHNSGKTTFIEKVVGILSKE